MFADNRFVQRLITSSTAALTSGAGKQVFDVSTLGAVVDAVVRTTAHYTETLASDEGPLEPLLARTISAVAAGLSNQLAGTGAPRALLAKGQLIELAQFAFEEVARQPLQMLGTTPDPRKTALAQVLGSVTRALGDAPAKLLNGEGLLTLTKIALHTGLQNAGKLLDFDTLSPRGNLLCSVLQQIFSPLSAAPPVSGFATQQVLLEVARRLLPLASANAIALVQNDNLLKHAIERTLSLALGALDGRVNAANLPVLLEGVVRQVLWDELDLQEEAALTRAAIGILRAA